MASIKKTKFGTYRAKIVKAGYKAQTATKKTKQEAQDWVIETLSAMNLGTHTVNTKAAKVKTVSDLFDRYIAECETVMPNGKTKIMLSKSSINTAKRVRESAFFMSRRLNQIQPEDIRKWRETRLQEVGPATVDREMTAVSSVFRQAAEWGEPIAFNPVRLVLRPKYNKDGREFGWNDAQIEAVCSVLGYEEGVRPTGKAFVAYAFLFAIETSMRQGEIARLTVADYNRKDGFVQIHKSKNGSKRQTSLNGRATELLTLLCEGKPLNHKIFNFTGGTIGCYFTAARQAAGVDGLTFHDSRHEAITRMVPMFTNVLELAKQTGHKKLQSLQTYYNPAQKTIRSRLLDHDQKMDFQKTGGQLRSVA